MRLAKTILAVVALLLLAWPAHALGPYYIMSSGADMASQDGTSVTEAWRTISYANATLPVPDNEIITVYIGPGVRTSDAFPNPVSVPINLGRFAFVALNFSGTNAAPGGYDSLSVLSGKAAQGQSENNAAGTLRKTRMTIRGFKIGGDVGLDSTARGDSVSHCLVDGNLNERGSDSCDVVFNVFRGGNSLRVAAEGYTGGSSTYISDNLNFSYNVLTRVGETMGGLSFRVQFGYRQFEHAVCDAAPTNDPCYNLTKNLVFERNSITGHVSGAAESGWFAAFNLNNALFQYNNWDITKGGSTYEFFLKIRTTSNGVTFNGDRFVARGPGFQHFNWSQRGESYMAMTKNITLDSVWVRTDQGIPFRMIDGGPHFASVTYSVFATGLGQAVQVADSVVGSNVFNHNTFVNRRTAGGVLNFYSVNNRWNAASTTTFTNNIVASVDGGLPAGLTPCAQSGNPTNTYGLINWGYRDHFNTSPADVGHHLNSDNNLFHGPTFNLVPGDQVMNWQLFDCGGDCSNKCSAIGNNTAWDNTSDTVRRDTLSNFGGADFGLGTSIDSIPGSTFDPRIGQNSRARGIGTGPSDAGAVAFVVTAQINTDAPAYYFGSDVPAGTDATLQILVTNVGTSDLIITGIGASPGFEMDVSPTSVTLAAGVAQVVTVTYHKPNVGGATTEDVAFNSNDPNRPILRIPIALDPNRPDGEEAP